ncbi:hypothetical protein BS50DRAFT_211737 [Corynespora cassiicola Philippines]|uniref:Uncharacterized protein n=1 Tax=Corynespora cassiicola Philippines TaxID=1448308 RepID=A0A2T2N493_CORCC|nr:hypothetical protein BS50DRAFT_211737 [Corynespora cassiicola Philippines]
MTATHSGPCTNRLLSLETKAHVWHGFYTKFSFTATRVGYPCFFPGCVTEPWSVVIESTGDRCVIFRVPPVALPSTPMSAEELQSFFEGEKSHPPAVELRFHEQPEIHLTRNTTIKFTLRNLAPQDADPKLTSIFFQWEHWRTCSRSHLLLLQHTPNGLRRVHVPPEISPYDPDSIIIDDHIFARGVITLGPSATKTSCFWLTANYLKAMEPGERYTLLWPGKNMPIWNRGVPQQYKDTILRPRYMHPLTLPGGAHITFKTKTDEKPWPDRADVEKKYGYFEANMYEEKWRRKMALQCRYTPSPTEVGLSESSPCLQLTPGQTTTSPKQDSPMRKPSQPRSAYLSNAARPVLCS